MKVTLLYASLLCSSISAMEEYTTIKRLLGNPTELKTYLETKDQRLQTPLMRFLETGTDQMIQEILPILKDYDFNREVPGMCGETALYNACDRQTIIAAQELLRHGVNRNPPANAGSPVLLTYFNKNLPLLEFLLAEGFSAKIPEVVVNETSKHPDFAIFKSLALMERLP